jgi:polyhydroxyalkanoate synthesis regulator phasin
MAKRNMVVISRERLQEVLDDAVRRGRMTRDDASQLLTDLLSDVEQLLGRSRDQIEEAATTARKLAGKEVDRARRAAGMSNNSFPIDNYDDMTAAQVIDRLGDLTPAELRKVRDHERRNANRKSVLNAVDRKLDA